MSILLPIAYDMARTRRRRITGIIIFGLIVIVLLSFFGELPDAEIITP